MKETTPPPATFDLAILFELLSGAVQLLDFLEKSGAWRLRIIEDCYIAGEGIEQVNSQNHANQQSQAF